MNTQAQVQRLQPGQALALPRRGACPAVLAEGELLLQEPARWLGGTVVFAPAIRLLAPAPLPDLPEATMVAVRASSVVVPQAQPVWQALLRKWRLRLRTAYAA